MVYYTADITGEYNALYTPANQVFFIAHILPFITRLGAHDVGIQIWSPAQSREPLAIENPKNRWRFQIPRKPLDWEICIMKTSKINQMYRKIYTNHMDHMDHIWDIPFPQSPVYMAFTSKTAQFLSEKQDFQIHQIQAAKHEFVAVKEAILVA